MRMLCQEIIVSVQQYDNQAFRVSISCTRADRKFPRYKVRRVYHALFITQRD